MSWLDYYWLLKKYRGELSRATAGEMKKAAEGKAGVEVGTMVDRAEAKYNEFKGEGLLVIAKLLILF